MTDNERKEFLEALRKVKNDVTKDRKSSREFLRKVGFITPTGRRAKKYRHICIPSIQD